MVMIVGGWEWWSYAAPAASGLSWLTLPNHPLGPLDDHDGVDDDHDHDHGDNIDDDDVDGSVNDKNCDSAVDSQTLEQYGNSPTKKRILQFFLHFSRGLRSDVPQWLSDSVSQSVSFSRLFWCDSGDWR